MEVDLAKLGRFIADQFDLDQLQALCRELDVPFDQLLGDTRSARAFDLVTLMRDRGQLSMLLAAVAQARPDTFDPQDFEAGDRQGRARRRWRGWLILLGIGVLLALALVLWTWRSAAPSTPTATSPAPAAVVASPSLIPVTPTAGPTDSPLPSATPSPSASATPSPSASATPSPSASATPTPSASVTPTPSASVTPTPSASATPTPSATPSPTATATPTPSATATITPSPTTTATPSATPVLSPLSPALVYDAGSRTLTMTPGDATLQRARLCIPLNAYQSAQVVYFIESVADSLGLPLPAQARVTHTYPQAGSIVYTLQVRRHPMAGVKVTGEEADFTGCDLVVSEDVRRLLGFPISLGEFDDPPRFDHGWVTVQFLP